MSEDYSRHSSNSPPFSRLLTSALGSPFVTTAGLPNLLVESNALGGTRHSGSSGNARAASEPLPDHTPERYPRASSPTPSTSGFSMIGTEEVDVPPELYGYCTPTKFGTFGRRTHSSPTLNYYSSSSDINPSSPYISPASSLRSLIPRLWDAFISYPTRGILSPSRTFTPSSSSSLNRKSRMSVMSSEEESRFIDHRALAPLDDDEGELIDDEACFVAVDAWGLASDQRASRARVVTGIDIISLLPPELALYVFQCLSPPHDRTLLDEDVCIHALRSLIASTLVSRQWNRLATDNVVWKSCFSSRWGEFSEHLISNFFLNQKRNAFHASVRGGRPKSDMSLTFKAQTTSQSVWSARPVLSRKPTSSVRLEWRNVYRDRLELEGRWRGTARVYLKSNKNPFASPYLQTNFVPESSNGDEVAERWEPRMTQLSGHTDSVYCLEFSNHHIITGSRDRTIKVWSQKTGRCLGTFGGGMPLGGQGHSGSILCLKFLWDDFGFPEDPDSELNNPPSQPSSVGRQRSASRERDTKKSPTGILFSGSSDSTVLVWTLSAKTRRNSRKRPSVWGPGREHEIDLEWHDEDDYEVTARVRATLHGHDSGVLDLRVDEKWIVSCSKDAVIRVWTRDTEELHLTLRGHDGPVNAIGLQYGKLVSASGDGKLILWDVVTGERLKTLEGHDRGLACVEFSDGVIISGSNDCSIKVWSASTGQCLHTLVGHTALVRALAFDPIRRLLVSASYDKSIRVWDVKTGRLIRKFSNAHKSHIFDVKFDGCKIISTSHDHKIVILNFNQDLEYADLLV